MSQSALTTPAYRRFLIGSTVTTHGLWILRVCMSWQAWLLTESEFFVAAVAVASYLPVAVLGPVFGALADRWDRRKSAQVFNLLNTLITAGLFVLSAFGWMTPAALFSLALAFGICSGGYTPMRLALMANLVPSMQLASAVQACPEGTPPSGSAPARNPGADGIVRLGFPVQQARRRPSLRRWTGRGRPNRPRRHRPA